MPIFSITSSLALDASTAASELATRVETELGGASEVGGGLLLATAAAGSQGPGVGQLLSDRWPGADLGGTSFEGLVSRGRVWRDRPALGFLGWRKSPGEPAVVAFEPKEQGVDEIADGILSAVGENALESSDLVLLFPDAHALPPIEQMLVPLESRLGGPTIAGAAAMGVEGAPATAWLGRGDCVPGSLIALVVPGRSRPRPLSSLVEVAGGSRAASDWLRITSCRSRWIDRLEGEIALVRIRRELDLGRDDAIEPHLGRLLVRLRRRGRQADEDAAAVTEALADEDAAAVTEAHDEERYIVGIDDHRGAFSLPVEVERGDDIALAWPDADLAREGLLGSIAELGASPWLLQFSCRARDAELHGDEDLESAWIAAHANGRDVLGTVAPFQLGPGSSHSRAPRLLVHSNILAALSGS